jgi:hypothetical protein
MAAERRLPHRHEPGLGALALHADVLGVEVDADRLHRHELLRAQARGVGELQERAVAQGERRGRRDPVEQARELGRGQDARQLLGALGRRDELGGVGGHGPVLAQAAEHRAQGGELARDGGAHEPPLGQRGGVAPQRPVVHLRRLQAPADAQAANCPVSTP